MEWVSAGKKRYFYKLIIYNFENQQNFNNYTFIEFLCGKSYTYIIFFFRLKTLYYVFRKVEL